MTISDALIGQARKEWAERRERINSLMLAVIQSHLLLEQFIEGLLDAADVNCDDLTFFKKAKAGQEIHAEEIEDWVWLLVFACNELRNKIAHTFDQDQIKVKMDAVREKSLATLQPRDVGSIQEFQ